MKDKKTIYISTSLHHMLRMHCSHLSITLTDFVEKTLADSIQDNTTNGGIRPILCKEDKQRQKEYPAAINAMKIPPQEEYGKQCPRSLKYAFPIKTLTNAEQKITGIDNAGSFILIMLDKKSLEARDLEYLNKLTDRNINVRQFSDWWYAPVDDYAKTVVRMLGENCRNLSKLDLHILWEAGFIINITN